jgi:methyltransferase (TIGR00027 family)
MARTENDSWDLASSVGATATMVAAGRAMASQAPDALINDPFAAPLVRAVGVDFFTKMVDGELDTSGVGDDPSLNLKAMIDGMGLRTKFFDDFFIRATDVGVRQAVILASGLDARAYRLPWPAGMTVYEVDQPEVIEFKTTTLAGLGAKPTAERRAVAIDLRNDWPAALRAAGLDPTAPTAWSAEGLLIYLPPEAQDRLFDNITALSAPGSSVATEYVPGLADFDDEKARALTDRWRDRGFELDLDMPSLVFTGERNHVVEYLARLGWQMTTVSRAELFTRQGLDLPRTGETGDLFEDLDYVSGQLG